MNMIFEESVHHMCHSHFACTSKIEVDGHCTLVMIIFSALSFQRMQGSDLGDDTLVQACKDQIGLLQGGKRC